MQLRNIDRVAARLATMGASGRLPAFLTRFDGRPGGTAELCDRDRQRVALIDRGVFSEFPDSDSRLGHVKSVGSGEYDLTASYTEESDTYELKAVRDYGHHQLHLSALRTKEGSAHVTVADSDGDCHVVITAEHNGRESTAFFSCDQLAPAGQQWLLAQ